jgi:hypothetical protein
VPPRMSFPQAISLLEAHAEEYSGFLIEAHLAKVEDSVSHSLLEGVLDQHLARAIATVWEHYKRRASLIEELPHAESVLGFDSLEIDPCGNHKFYLRTVVEVSPDLFGDPPAEEKADE